MSHRKEKRRVVQSKDTPPEIEKLQISLIKKSSVSKRLSSVRSLTKSVVQLSRRAILRSNPSLSEREVDLLFLKIHYGKELSSSVDEYLNMRDREKA